MAKLKELDVEDFLAACVTICPEQIQEEFINLPAQLAYWNERYSMASADYLRAKQIREQVEAQLFIQCRNDLLAKAALEAEPDRSDTAGTKTVKRTIKAPSKDAVEAVVGVHPDYIAAKTAENEAEIAKGRMYGVVDAIRTKRDMLISLGAQLRVEMLHDPVIRDRVSSGRM